MLATLRNRNFSLLWLGGLISLSGNWILLTALPFYVYNLTGSALATSGLMMAYIAPGIVFGSVAGVFVDRWDRRRTMIGVSLAQAAVIPLLVLVRSPEQIWLVYLVAFLEAGLGQFFGPAENALLPTLVGEEHLVAANSLNAMNDNLARMIGPALGGVLLGVLGLSSVIWADALSYLAVGLLVMLVSAPARPPRSQPDVVAEKAVGQWRQVWQEWLAGLRLVRHDQLLLAIFAVFGIALFGDAILSALLVVFVQDGMGLGPVEFGWIMTARGVGGLLGGLLIAQFGSKFKPVQLIGGGLAVSGLLILVMVNVPSLPVVMGLMVVGGPFFMGWIISGWTLLQTSTADEFRGRVFGAFGTTTTLLMFVGSGLAGLLADYLGATSLLNAAALIYVVAGVLGWVVLKRVMGMRG